MAALATWTSKSVSCGILIIGCTVLKQGIGVHENHVGVTASSSIKRLASALC
jgi:hypothetical protein